MERNVLICSAGRRVSLVKSFQAEARLLIDSGAKVFTSDLRPELSPACQVSDATFRLGYFSEPNYMSDLLEACKKNSIELVVPTLDTELKLLAAHREAFEQENIHIVVSDLDLVTICRDKNETASFFNQHGIETVPLASVDNLEFPVFIKPIDGSSSTDIFYVRDESRLAPFMLDTSRFIHMKYLEPADYAEFTIDMYYDRNSQLQCVVPRERLETRAGEVSKGVTRRNKLVQYVTEKLGSLPGARGCLTLQVFQSRNRNEIYGIEINPRFGGGYPISHHAGANFPRWIIQEYLFGEKISRYDSWKNNFLVLRYDNDLTFDDYDQ